MFTPIQLSSLPEQVTLPAIAGYPPLVPMVPYPVVVSGPRALAAIDACREGGLLAWIVKREPRSDAPENLLPVALICQVGSAFPDEDGQSRTVLHAVARCTWTDFDDGDDAMYATATVQPVGLKAVRDPALEPLAVGLILEGLLGDGDSMESMLATATKDVGGLADEVFFNLFLSLKPDDTLFELHQQVDPRLRFQEICDVLEIAPVALPEIDALTDLRAQAEAMLTGGEPPDIGVLMDSFFPRVLDPDGSVPVEMVIALGRAIALTGAD